MDGMGIRAGLDCDGAERPQRTSKSWGVEDERETIFFFRSCFAINVPYKGPNFPAFFHHFLESPCTLLHEFKLSVQKCVSLCAAISTAQGLRRYLEW